MLSVQYILPVPVDDEYINKIETWEKNIEVWDRDRVIVEDNWTPEMLRTLEVDQQLKVSVLWYSQHRLVCAPVQANKYVMSSYSMRKADPTIDYDFETLQVVFILRMCWHLCRHRNTSLVSIFFGSC